MYNLWEVNKAKWKAAQLSFVMIEELNLKIITEDELGIK